jgi:hypothetical protein
LPFAAVAVAVARTCETSSFCSVGAGASTPADSGFVASRPSRSVRRRRLWATSAEIIGSTGAAAIGGPIGTGPPTGAGPPVPPTGMRADVASGADAAVGCTPGWR